MIWDVADISRSIGFSTDIRLVFLTYIRLIWFRMFLRFRIYAPVDRVRVAKFVLVCIAQKSVSIGILVNVPDSEQRFVFVHPPSVLLAWLRFTSFAPYKWTTHVTNYQDFSISWMISIMAFSTGASFGPRPRAQSSSRSRSLEASSFQMMRIWILINDIR